jgi:hypothetical protein
VDRANKWIGQGAILATTAPAGATVARLWAQTRELLA